MSNPNRVYRLTVKTGFSKKPYTDSISVTPSKMNFEEVLKSVLEKGYSIDKKGSLISFSKKSLKSVNSQGYHYFTFHKDGKRYTIFAHKLQAYLKFGMKAFKKGVHVRHLDGNSKNNNWDNIELGTQSDNFMDRPSEERLAHAIKASSHNRKFSNQEVRDIKKYHESCRSYKQTMLKFGIPNKSSLFHLLKSNYKTEKIALR